MEDGETLFANEIYVNGDRWYLARDTDEDAPRRTASQAEEDELARRLLHSTPATYTERDSDATRPITEHTTGTENNPNVVYYRETTAGDDIPGDLRDLDMHDTIFEGDTDFLPNDQLDRFSDTDSNNGAFSDIDLDDYYTPPASPTQISDSSAFNITQGSQQDYEKIIRRLPPSVIRGRQPHQIVPLNLIPSPSRLDSSINQPSGNYTILLIVFPQTPCFSSCMYLKKGCNMVFFNDMLCTSRSAQHLMKK